jgi:hypothetical protein
MAIVNLNAIRQKFRKLTGAGNAQQITNAVIDDYLNSFYSYDFPAQFRSLKLKDKYTFNTIQGIDTYAFNSEQYTTVEMPCYCMKREIKLFQDPWNFYGVNFNWQQQQNFAFGSGIAGPYSGQLSAFPLIRSVNNKPQTVTMGNITPNTPPSPITAPQPYPSQAYSGFAAGRVQNILITANTSTSTLNVTDDGNGALIEYINDANGFPLYTSPAGSINYQTGAISVTFSQAIPQGNAIQAQYNPVQEAIPLSILFFQNQFTLRPVPDQGYTVELIAYRQPSQALFTTLSGGGTPELSEWWECLAFGAAKKFYEDRLDPDGIALMDKSLRERYDVAYTRTYAQLGKQRIGTIYADQLTGNYGGNMAFGNNGSV